MKSVNKPLSAMIRMGLVSASFITTSSSFAQESEYLKPVEKAATQITDSAVSSQLEINKITAQIGDKLQQFKTVNKEIDG